MNSEFHPPESIKLLLTDTALPELPVYIPVATKIMSPNLAFSIAPSIEAHGVVDERQSLLSLPPEATYQSPVP